MKHFSLMCKSVLFLSGLFLVSGVCPAGDSGQKTITADEFVIRDPFILPDPDHGIYYLYAQSKNQNENDYSGVEVYTSKDLVNWTLPTPVLVLPRELNVRSVWAPEVHRYKDNYYLFTTLTFEDPGQPMRRGTWIFKSDSPAGPFTAVKNEPFTPADWLALDGTLWEEDGTPYMIFCHEWAQIDDGTIELVALKPDLSDTDGTPQTLFAASVVPNIQILNKNGMVTDGPFIYRSPKSNRLFMLWSSFLKQTGYCVLITWSESGKLAGPWTVPTPIYTQNGGHGMLFTSLDGKLMLSLHQPNSGSPERLKLFEVIDDGTTLKIVDSQ